MNDNTQSPFTLDEPEWLEEVPDVRRPEGHDAHVIGDAFLPDVDDAVGLLHEAEVMIPHALEASSKAGCSVETAARLLAALGRMDKLKASIGEVHDALYRDGAGMGIEIVFAGDVF